jgi:3-hydroxyacyl-CoA dehydrogenase
MTVGQFYNKEDKIMAFKKVVVVGGGVLGSQIAYQVAYKGFDVTVWLRSEGSIERAKPKFARWHETYLKDLEATKALIGTGTKLYPRGLVDDFENLTVEKVER